MVKPYLRLQTQISGQILITATFCAKIDEQKKGHQMGDTGWKFRRPMWASWESFGRIPVWRVTECWGHTLIMLSANIDEQKKVNKILDMRAGGMKSWRQMRTSWESFGWIPLRGNSRAMNMINKDSSPSSRSFFARGWGELYIRQNHPRCIFLNKMRADLRLHVVSMEPKLWLRWTTEQCQWKRTFCTIFES